MALVQPPAFAALLRQYRLAAGLTQEELADRARLSTRAVSDLERGVRRTPYRDTVHSLADALDLGADDRILFEAAYRSAGRSWLAFYPIRDFRSRLTHPVRKRSGSGSTGPSLASW